MPRPSGSLIPINLALALGVTVALDAVPQDLDRAVEGLPVVDNRLVVLPPDDGPAVIDDTYNSNPAGARHALTLLAATGSGRRFLVTPGMVELGSEQEAANRELAAAAAAAGVQVVVVGRTNRAALLAGVAEAVDPRLVTVATRDDAVSWIREHAAADDVSSTRTTSPTTSPDATSPGPRSRIRLGRVLGGGRRAGGRQAGVLEQLDQAGAGGDDGDGVDLVDQHRAVRGEEEADAGHTAALDGAVGRAGEALDLVGRSGRVGRDDELGLVEVLGEVVEVAGGADLAGGRTWSSSLLMTPTSTSRTSVTACSTTTWVP